MLRDYMTVLNILMQNPDASFDDVVGKHVTLKTEQQEEEEKEIVSTDTPTDRKRFTANDIEF